MDYTKYFNNVEDVKPIEEYISKKIVSLLGPIVISDHLESIVSDNKEKLNIKVAKLTDGVSAFNDCNFKKMAIILFELKNEMDMANISKYFKFVTDKNSKCNPMPVSVKNSNLNDDLVYFIY